MAKKGKAKVAASNCPKVACSNIAAAESAPSQSVQNQGSPENVILGKSEEVNEEKEAKVGPYDPEEADKSNQDENSLGSSQGKNEEEAVDAVKSDEVREQGDEVEEVETDKQDDEKKGLQGEVVDDGEEENKDNGKLVESKEDGNTEEVRQDEKVEEVKDGKVEGVKEDQEIEEIKDDHKVEEIKEDHRVEQINEDANKGSRSVDGDMHDGMAKEGGTGKEVNNNGGTENAANTRAKRIRKRKKAAGPGGKVVGINAKRKSVTSNAVHAEENVPNNKAKRMQKRKKVAGPGTVDGKAEDVKEEINVGVVANDIVPEVEITKESLNEVIGNKKKENILKKAKKIWKGKKVAGEAAASEDKIKSDADKKVELSTGKNENMMAEGMGLIFMCNAKTKQDCFRYRLFGLPANKKELVAKIYKGMRLFLFDVDLKLMYGIYKAAGPGGYNIEPKAFKAAYPSQVHFSIVEDCLPLPEEKFKSAIKQNYFGRNKFNTQLSPEQVKDLCKLFRNASKVSKKKRPREVIRPGPEQTSSRALKRPRQEREQRDDRNSSKRGRREGHNSSGKARRDGRDPRQRSRRDERDRRPQDLYARREDRASPPRSTALCPISPVPYAYDQTVSGYYYRTDAPRADPRDYRTVDADPRSYVPLEYRDPYPSYREPVPREAVYREPLMLPRESLYREPLSLPLPLPGGALYREPAPLPREALYSDPALYPDPALLPREAVYQDRALLPREAVYQDRALLPREAAHREPAPYPEPMYPPSSTAAPYAPFTGYRY